MAVSVWHVGFGAAIAALKGWIALVLPHYEPFFLLTTKIRVKNSGTQSPLFYQLNADFCH